MLCKLCLLLLIFWELVSGLPVTEEEMKEMIQFRDALLLLDNCNTASVFMPSTSSADDLTSYQTSLQAMLSSPLHAACASCYLCHLHLHSEAHVPAYIYGTRALQMFPKLSPALNCIAALYYRQGNILRSSFYAELAYLHEPNRSQYIKFPDLGNTKPLHLFLKSKGGTAKKLKTLSSCPSFLHRIDKYSLLGDIFLSLEPDDASLLHAYWKNLQFLPQSLIGPSFYAYEAFLDIVEEAETVCMQNREDNEDDFTEYALHVHRDYNPEVTWPSDKTVIIFNYMQIDNVRRTFGENYMGLSNALDKLGGNI